MPGATALPYYSTDTRHTVYTMDALCQLDQLARAVQFMRDLQAPLPAGENSLTDIAVFAAQRRVDVLVARVLNGSCAPIPPHMVAALLAAPKTEEPPPLLLPSAYDVHFLAVAPTLPDLPPPPPRARPEDEQEDDWHTVFPWC